MRESVRFTFNAQVAEEIPPSDKLLRQLYWVSKDEAAFATAGWPGKRDVMLLWHAGQPPMLCTV